MQIIHITDGLKFTYDRGRQTDVEYVFGIENNKIVQKFTLTIDIVINYNELNNIIENTQIITVDTGYLLYSFNYEILYAHYMTQTIPKLYEYCTKYSDHALLIPKSRYNNLCKEILSLLNITNILILEDKKIYDVKNYVISTKFLAPPSNFIQTHIDIYKKIRLPLNITTNNTPHRKIYLQRDSLANINFGNSNTGAMRQIINERVVIDELISLGFEIVTLGTKFITEKKELLCDAKIIITPIGANCMNLIFSNAPKNIIYLSNDKNFGFDYYTNLCKQVNNAEINTKNLISPGINVDPKNIWNSSFIVNIDKLKNTIQELS